MFLFGVFVGVFGLIAVALIFDKVQQKKAEKRMNEVLSEAVASESAVNDEKEVIE